jgi:hypothetical protein
MANYLEKDSVAKRIHVTCTASMISAAHYDETTGDSMSTLLRRCGFDLTGTVCNKDAIAGVVLGAYLVTTQTPGVSAVQLQRQQAGSLQTVPNAAQASAGMVRPNRDCVAQIGRLKWMVKLWWWARKGGRGVRHKAVVVGAMKYVLVGFRPMAKKPRKGGHCGKVALVLCQTAA